MSRGKSRKRSRSQKKWPALVAIAAVGVVALTLVGFALAVSMTPTVSQAEIQRFTERTAKETAERAAKVEADAEALRAKVAFPKDRPLSVIFKGDSITTGSYASSEDLTFTSLVTAALAEHGPVDADVAGVSGQTAAKGLDDLPEDPYDLTVVLYGQNESFLGLGEEFTRSYPALLEGIRSASPSGALICVSTFLDKKVAATFNDVIRDSCEAAGGAYVYITDLFLLPGDRAAKGDLWFGGAATDTAHPNDKGHAAIAARVDDKISVQ